LLVVIDYFNSERVNTKPCRIAVVWIDPQRERGGDRKPVSETPLTAAAGLSAVGAE